MKKYTKFTIIFVYLVNNYSLLIIIIMNNQVLTAGIISIIYFLMKFIEMRFILKENKPLKQLVIDTLIVFIAATSTILLLEQFNLNEIIGNLKETPGAFINKPDF